MYTYTLYYILPNFFVGLMSRKLPLKYQKFYTKFPCPSGVHPLSQFKAQEINLTGPKKLILLQLD